MSKVVFFGETYKEKWIKICDDCSENIDTIHNGKNRATGVICGLGYPDFVIVRVSDRPNRCPQVKITT